MTDHQQPLPETRPRIVVGVDGSECSKLALRWAARLAAEEGADIEAVIAWQLPVGIGWGAVLPDSYQPAADMEKILVEAIDDVFGSNRPRHLRTRVCEGDASAVLVDASEGALLTVVGSRGHGGFAGVLLGSVSARVAEHARCPVLVVHGDAAPAAKQPG